MKNLFKLVAIMVLVGVLSGCRKTADAAKEIPTDPPKVVKSANGVYNGIAIGDNTMSKSEREKADRIAAEVSKPVK